MSFREKYNKYLDLQQEDQKLLIATRSISSKNAVKNEYKKPELKYTKVYRFANEFKGTILGKIANQYLKRLSIKTGIQIPSDVEIGRGFVIGHFGCIVVNSKAVIGEDFIITQGCVVGMDMRGKRKGTPKIGNRVCMNANSVIVGNVTIGDDVLIAPNAFVNFDVPSHSIVVGNPATIHYRANAVENHIGDRSKVDLL